MFSRRFVGSDLTGYVSTPCAEKAVYLPDHGDRDGDFRSGRRARTWGWPPFSRSLADDRAVQCPSRALVVASSQNRRGGQGCHGEETQTASCSVAEEAPVLRGQARSVVSLTGGFQQNRVRLREKRPMKPLHQTGIRFPDRWRAHREPRNLRTAQASVPCHRRHRRRGRSRSPGCLPHPARTLRPHRPRTRIIIDWGAIADRTRDTSQRVRDRTVRTEAGPHVALGLIDYPPPFGVGPAKWRAGLRQGFAERG